MNDEMEMFSKYSKSHDKEVANWYDNQLTSALGMGATVPTGGPAFAAK